MLLYCVRHGESAYNAENRIQGQSDVPLSPLGCRQSEALAAALAGHPIEAVYSSPLRRARETAEPIARRLGLTVETDPRLMELDAGLFQGQLRTELDKLYPAELAAWLSGDMDFTIPGGESRRMLMLRGEAALRDIAARGHRQAVVVAHGGLLTVAFKALLTDPPAMHPFALQNGSISRLEIDGNSARLLSLSEVDHLIGVGLAGSGDL